MPRYEPSVRQKITIGFYGTVAIILALSGFTFMELRFLEQKVKFGEVISEFFDTTLEIRRFEKNYLLYGGWSDYNENRKYVLKARELLEGNIQGFNTIANPATIRALRNNLILYRTLMEKFVSNPRSSYDLNAILENDIRKTGKYVTMTAEDISKTERKNLQIMLSQSRHILLFSIIPLALLAIVIGQRLKSLIVRPLASLEKSMIEIAGGRYESFTINSKDKEIISLVNALNRMLRELELRQRHLVQSEKLASLGTLLSGVAHELNNPLSNISSSSQILSEEINYADPEFKRELLSQIEEQTDRARNIVRSLLEFSRDKDFKKEYIPLKRLFEETVRFVKGQIPPGMEISIDVPGEIIIFADKQRIQQAFLNLIRNGLEAMEREGSLFIKARRHSALEKAEGPAAEIFNYFKYHGKCTLEDDTVDIEIRDTGTGIPAELLSRIFDPFFTTKDVGKGSGLGLYIVHEIIEEHDGCIAVDSIIGKGTLFLIRLPEKSGSEVQTRRENGNSPV